MRLKHIARKGVVGRLSKLFDSLHIRQAFKAEFAAKTCHTFAVIIHRLQTVPYAPQMGVAYIVAFYSDVMRFTYRRTGCVWSVFVIFSYFGFKYMIEEFLGPFDILLHMYPSHMHIFNFIVAVPYSERGMMTEAFYIVLNLFFYIVKKVIIKERIGLTGKLKILPNK